MEALDLLGSLVLKVILDQEVLLVLRDLQE